MSAAAAAPMALSMMQQMQASRQASKDASAQADYQVAMANREADAQVADLRKQTETQKRRTRSAFLRRQAQSRVQGAVSGAGASAEVMAGAAADNERELVNLDRQADETAARIRAETDLIENEAKARASKAKRSARQAVTGSLLSMGAGMSGGQGGSMFNF